MFQKCLVGAGLLALLTVMAVPATSEGGPFGRRVRTDTVYYTDAGTTVSYGTPVAQPNYPEMYRTRFGRRYTTMPDPFAMPPGFVPAGSDTVTYSTSGFRPADVARGPTPTDDRAHLRIVLPAEKAEIWIEGQKSEQTKRVEDYVSPPLTPGKQYFYQVRARWSDPAGKQVERTQSFPIRPGQPVFLDLRRPEMPNQGVKPVTPREEIPRPKQ